MGAQMRTVAEGRFVYQLIGEDYVASREWAALQWGYSTGKSRVVLTRLVRDPRINYTLFFCRKDNVDTIRKEIEKHTTLAYTELTGSTASVVTIVEKFSRCLRSQRTKHIFLMNHDKAKSLEQVLTALEPDAVVVDESTAIKSWKSERTKATCRLGHLPSVVFRALMAGEMAPQQKADYWSQFFFLDKGELLGPSYYWFMNKYFVKMGYDLVLKPGARDAIMDVVSRNTSILRTSDTRVPKRVDLRMIPVEPTARQLEMIERLGKGYLHRPDGVIQTLSNGAVSVEKQQQVCGGYIKWLDTYAADGSVIEEGMITRLEDNPKLDRLVALLKEEMPERLVPGNPKIVIWAQRSEEIKMIAERLRAEKIRCVILSGSLSTVAQNSASKRLFFEDPETRVFIGQADMGIGLNELIVADVAIWYSNSHRIESRLQAEMRLDRPDQQSNVLIFIDFVLQDQWDAAVAFAVAQARLDVIGFTTKAQLLEAARAKMKVEAQNRANDPHTV